MHRIILTLDPVDSAALLHMARSDCRPLKDQIRYILRQEATKRGLLPQEEARHAA